MAGSRSAATSSQNHDLNEAKGAAAGVEFSFGAANVSVGYVFFDPDNGDSTNEVAVSGDIGLLPGVTLKGDVVYNQDCACANNGESADDATQGVVTVQLDY